MLLNVITEEVLKIEMDSLAKGAPHLTLDQRPRLLQALFPMYNEFAIAFRDMYNVCVNNKQCTSFEAVVARLGRCREAVAASSTVQCFFLEQGKVCMH